MYAVSCLRPILQFDCVPPIGASTRGSAVFLDVPAIHGMGWNSPSTITQWPGNSSQRALSRHTTNPSPVLALSNAIATNVPSDRTTNIGLLASRIYNRYCFITTSAF
jgi:hypothetical protein